MGGDQTLIAIGVGCRKGCPADEIVALVRETLAALPAEAQPSGIFTIEEKRHEAGLTEAAVQLGLPLTFLDKSALQSFAAAAQTTSARIEQLHGVPSVAETAALAGAGQGGVLLVARRASARATCAIAGPLRRSAP